MNAPLDREALKAAVGAASKQEPANRALDEAILGEYHESHPR